MITDRRAFDPDAQPDVILHREQALTAIASAVRTDEVNPRPVVIDGPSGVGKTTVARETLNRAEAELFDISTAYVGCARKSRAAVLRDLVSDTVGSHAVYPSKGSAELVDTLARWDTEMLVVLDELDQCEEPEVLRDCYDLDGCHVIAIANEETAIFAHAEEGLQSRLAGREHVHLDRYTDTELEAILDARITAGLQSRALIHDDAIDAIVAAADGDARSAIAMLQAAIKAVDSGVFDSVTPETVRGTTDDAAETLLQTALQKLNDETRLVYHTLEEADEQLRSGELFERYQAASENPVTRRTFTDYLNKLQSYGLVADNGEATSRRRYYTADPL
jgi:cell division control protein 6